MSAEAVFRGRMAGRGRVAGAVRAHALFLALALGGVALRVVVALAYQPALFSPDSQAYLVDSTRLEPPALWPIGYPTFLRLLPLDAGLAVVPSVQHALGLAIAALLYVLLLRLGVRRWLAALATAPVLLDAYQLNIEQYVLSETLFELLLAGAVAALLWRRPLGTGAAVLAGALVAAVALTRAVGVVAVVPALLAVVLLTSALPRRRRLGRAAAFLAVFAAAVGGYAVWHHAAEGSYALAGSAGRRLYGRVAPWVDCGRFSVPAYERVLCPSRPPGERPRVYRMTWLRSSPIQRLELPPGKTRSGVAGDFARRAIAGQPGAYARAVLSDFANGFAPTKEARPGGYRAAQWRFQTRYPIPGYPPTWSPDPPAAYHASGSVDRRLAGFLRGYQRFGYVPGPLLALMLVAGLAAALLARRTSLRSAAFLLPALTVALCLGSVALVPFSWRYQLPQLVLLPPAAAIAATAFARARRRSPTPGRSA